MKKTANIIFIGGVHGVGKGYLCDNITLKLLNIKHLSSSEVLKWDKGKNKEVRNIKNNQDKLVINLFKIIEPNKNYM